MRLLAFDIGSSSARAALFDEFGRRIPRTLVARQYSLRCTNDGGLELSPAMLLHSLQKCFTALSAAPTDMISAGAFWHGLLGLNEKLRPITPIYTWADSRSRVDAERLRREFSEEATLQRTGCMLRFPFWPAKLRWLNRTNRALFRRVRFWVSPSDWLFQELFGELRTSASMASATGIFNRATRSWDALLCDAVGLETKQLVPIHDMLSRGRIFTAIGDGATGNLGSGAVGREIAAVNLGTSAAVRVILPRESVRKTPFGLFRYIVDSENDVLGGAISNCGNLHEWAKSVAGRTALSRKSAATDNIIALPFLVAERAPDWPELPAGIVGLTSATTRPEIFRALSTSAFYQLAEVFDKVGTVQRIVVSGGLTRSIAMLQVMADSLGRDLELSGEIEASLRGAAVHALRQSCRKTPGPEQFRIIKFDPALAKRHLVRRKKQRLLKQLLLDA